MALVFNQNGKSVKVVDAEYIQPGVASFYLLAVDDGAAFIDTGTSHSLPQALGALNELGLTASDVRYVIPTHVHLDHAGGAGAMMQAFTHATLIVHPRGARHMIDPSRLIEGTVAVYGADRARALYGEIVPVPEHRVTTVADNDRIDFNGCVLRFVDTPGHARHHFCVIDEAQRAVFTGDTMGISYRIFDNAEQPFLFATTPPVQFEPEALHASVDRVAAVDPQTLYLTHFGPIAPTDQLFRSLHEQIEQYVAFAKSLNIDDGLENAMEALMGNYLAELALRHGAPIPEAEIRRYLTMDARLNAQGVALWWRRENKQQKTDPR